jgi:hypothetical protein
MNFNQSAIAAKLNVLDSAIIEIKEWENVLWVRFVGGCRFVSKKIGAIKMKLTVEKHAAKWTCRSEVPTANKHFPETAWVSINKSGIVGQSKEAVGTKAPSQELIDFALAQVANFEVKITSSQPAAVPARKWNRSSCLNCGITNTILLGSGYCTDCHGEC